MSLTCRLPIKGSHRNLFLKWGRTIKKIQKSWSKHVIPIHNNYGMFTFNSRPLALLPILLIIFSILQSFTSFMPCVDGYVITDTPAQLIKAGHVSPVPLLIGCTNSDGTGLLSMLNFSDYEKGLSEEVVKATFKATYLHMYKVNCNREDELTIIASPHGNVNANQNHRSLVYSLIMP